MLLANEFTVGNINKASAVTLVLPCEERGEAFLVGTSPKGPAAIFLSGQHQFRWIETTGNTYWGGLLIPKVRVEVDETSLLNANYFHARAGSLLRKGPSLSLQALNTQHHSGLLMPIVIEDGLIDTGEESVSFSKWQVVIGTGSEKRILYRVDVRQEPSE